MCLAMCLADAIKEKSPLSRFQELLVRGEKWALSGHLSTNIGMEDGMVPPLVSLAQYSRSTPITMAEHEEKELKTINGLFDLLLKTDGVLLIMNDPRYGVLSMSTRHAPSIVHNRLSARNDTDFNVPDPSYGGRTVWMIAVEAQTPKVMESLLILHFPQIDLELTDDDGNNPFRFLEMTDDDVRIQAEPKRRALGLDAGEGENGMKERQACRTMLRIAETVIIPQYKTALRSLVHQNLASVLPNVLLTIIQSFLRL
jgi:hypothetical protein